MQITNDTNNKIKYKAVHNFVLEKERNSEQRKKRTKPKQRKIISIVKFRFWKEKQDTQKP